MRMLDRDNMLTQTMYANDKEKEELWTQVTFQDISI